MTPDAGNPPRPEPPRRAWAALCVALALASCFIALIGRPEAFMWHAGDWPQRPWTPWTAPLAHLSTAHWLGNLLALAALALLGSALRAGRASALALALAWPLATASLALWPTVTRYGGLSATVHAGVAVLCVHCAFRLTTRPWALVLGAGLALKLAGEHAWRQPVVFDAHWGFNVVLAAHLGGALAGALCALAIHAPGLLARRRTQKAALSRGRPP